MKKWVLGLIFLSSSCSAIQIHAQSPEVQQLLLDVEKLAQLKNILSDMKKGYEMVSRGYGTIKNISEGNFDLHRQFLNGLLEISPVVKSYKRISDIIATQVRLVSDYKRALKLFGESGSFTPEELRYITGVYANLFTNSIKNIEALAKVVTPGQLRMSDDERLSAIDTVWKEVEEGYTFLKHFNNTAKVLALQRAKESHDVDVMRNLHNLH